jgi:MFS family permease
LGPVTLEPALTNGSPHASSSTERELRPGVREWLAGWRTVAAAFVAMGVGWNFASVAASLFLKPMQAEFGWSRTALSFGPMAGFIVALLLPITGLLLDRFGARRIIITGLLFISVAFALFACVPANHAIFWATTVWMGFAGAVCNSVVLARGVTPWFSKQLGTAIGFMMTGASVSAAIAVPSISYIVRHYGWRSGFWALCGVTLCLGLPLALVWFHEPKVSLSAELIAGLKRDPVHSILRSTQFWQLTAGSAVAALPIGGFIGHLIPMLSDRGLSVTTVAGLGTVFALGVGIGRVINGALLDRLHPPLVIATTLLLAAAGATFLLLANVAAVSWFLLGAANMLIGLAQGAEGDYIIFFSMRLFGLGNFSRVVSILAMVISIGMAVGGLLFAKAYDFTGTYRPALIAGAILYALGGIIFATIRMKRSPIPSSLTGRLDH